MRFSFEANIYKTGINLCVDVPLHITNKMKPVKGYIPIKGKINLHSFQQTLVPVKNAAYRLFVNGPMLKDSHTKLGDVAAFKIEQNTKPAIVPMPPAFKNKLIETGLMPAFKALTPYRQKEILKYMGFLKTEGSLVRNIEKVIAQLKE